MVKDGTGYSITQSVFLKENGTISPSGSVHVKHGDNQTFTITPKKRYEIASLMVNGVNAKLIKSTYTFINITKNHTINVSFKQIIHTITVTTGKNGTIPNR
ncbi:hypothetical protein CN692_24100 [Bacillus sp. AFS002410]|uniref:InlB B-repeat-containing protein n=1 Tax=Bacillus sp. AFS002410 TaxID=2033481 RepID=UPI000BEFC05C|nr:hypothetical protein [Bacillus sp. AFS002410]PEJ48371.1 hypothetical protein CN692_24100 [Bacillus sp. AFS002410]